jgi:cephalosporin hydroxylase
VAGLPPTADIDLERDSLLNYWRERARQHTRDSYAGVPMSKFPEDLRVYEHLLWLSWPNTVIEIGTHFGGSALWFRDRLRALQTYRRVGGRINVISVDTDQSNARSAVAAADPHHADSVTLIEADTRDPETAERVAALLEPDARCLVVEDSAHDYESTAASLRSFSCFVPPGGFLVVEDGCVDIDAMRISADWPRGVLPALHDWLGTADGGAFRMRRDLELYGISCHPEGYLERRSDGIEPRSG